MEAVPTSETSELQRDFMVLYPRRLSERGLLRVNSNLTPALFLSLQMDAKTRSAMTTPSVRATAVALPSACVRKRVSRWVNFAYRTVVVALANFRSRSMCWGTVNEHCLEDCCYDTGNPQVPNHVLRWVNITQRPLSCHRRSPHPESCVEGSEHFLKYVVMVQAISRFDSPPER
jgi:hypothetical protein